MAASLAKPLNTQEQTTNSLLQVRLSRWLTIALLLLAAWVLGRLVWQFITPAQTLTPWQPVTQQSQQNNINSSSSVDIQAVVNSNMFGLYTETPVAKPKPQTQAPETKLNLTLVGVVASSNAEKSLAVIANRGQQITYGIDETIEGTEAKLVSVLPDRVIISNRGNQEALMLEGLDYVQQGQNGTNSSASSSNIAMVNDYGSGGQGGSNTSNGITLSDEQIQQIQQQDRNNLSQQQLDDLAVEEGDNEEADAKAQELAMIRASIVENPETAFKYIGLSQRMVDGQLQGYQIRPGSNRALFDSVGLLDGDVAVEMNGKDLTDPQQMSELWSEVSTSNSWNLTVERDGQLHEINIGF